MNREPGASPWEVIYNDDGKPMGTVRKEINEKRQKFCAYRALPVCPGLNWSDTYPDRVAQFFADRNDAIAWVKSNPL